MPATQTYANAMLNREFAGSVYVGLFTALPTRTTPGTEVSYSGYARQLVTFAAAANGEKASSAEVQFPVAESAGGTVVGFGFFTAATGGTLMLYESVTLAEDDDPFVIGIDDVPTFPAGSLVAKEG